MDNQTTILELREIVRRFVAERDWQQFHSPKNLSMALSIEAAELMEHFQWLTIEQSREAGKDARQIELIKEEMADVLCYVMALANELNVDLSKAVIAKMKRNETKYPKDQYRGHFEKPPSVPE
jgi:NTP pyrophosphatase (non-canonical NTP hydrolase)